jgi:putative MATE family efflux protein
MHGMRDSLFNDHDFYSTLLRLAIPIATQQLVLNALNAVDVLMVGQLGETAVAAVGLAGQVFFLMSLFLFGVGSGAAIFSAQFWGRGDLANVRRMLGLALLLAVAGSAVFSLVAVLAPVWVMSVYTQDPAVIAAGSRYLRVVGLCYVPTAISTMYAMILRSTRQVKIPMAISVSALSLKTVLAYVLIFGYFGAPALGIMGAAVATVVARSVECIAMTAITYWRRLPAAAKLAELLDINRALVGRFARTATPVIFGEMLWSLGMTVYTGIYARIGTASVAAVSIASTIEGIALVPFMAMANAAAIMLGNRIGAGKVADAMDYARRFLVLSVVGAAVMGLIIFVSRGLLMSLYRISPEAQLDAMRVLAVMAVALWLKAGNLAMIVGIMRSGGDTRFAFLADIGPTWLLGIPIALLSAFVAGLPVYWVVLLVLVADEGTKFFISLWRVRSALWIHSVVAAI